jgi:ribose/xylose/arabinose/galactoside ABC-type transport system permease subunit
VFQQFIIGLLLILTVAIDTLINRRKAHDHG